MFKALSHALLARWFTMRAGSMVRKRPLARRFSRIWIDSVVTTAAFPMLVPVLLAASEGSAALLVGDPMGDAGAWLRLLVVFDVIFVLASLFVFEHIIEA
jgi:hypothetical protein